MIKNKKKVIGIAVLIVISGILLFVFTQPASIIPVNKISWTPSMDQELEGFGTKDVHIVITMLQHEWPDHKVADLSFYVEHVGSTWQSVTIDGTSQSVSSIITVPVNGDFRITLMVEIFFTDDNSYYTEIHTSRFGVFDPDYAGEEDITFFSGTTSEDAPVSVIWVFLAFIPLILIKKRSKHD